MQLKLLLCPFGAVWLLDNREIISNEIRQVAIWKTLIFNGQFYSATLNVKRSLAPYCAKVTRVSYKNLNILQLWIIHGKYIQCTKINPSLMRKTLNWSLYFHNISIASKQWQKKCIRKCIFDHVAIQFLSNTYKSFYCVLMEKSNRTLFCTIIYINI